METVLYPKNGCLIAHQNKVDGNSVTCQMDTCGGLANRIMVMQLWVMEAILLSKGQN